MLCNDPGVLSGSHHYHFSISRIAQAHYFYPHWCGHLFCDTGYFIRRMEYPVIMIAYVLDGTLGIDYGGQTHRVGKGCSLLVDLHAPHHYYAVEHLEFLFIGFAGLNSRSFSQYITHQRGILVREESTDLLEKSLYRLVSTYQTQQEITDAACSHMIYGMLCHMTEKRGIPEGRSSCVVEAIAFMRERLDKKLTLGMLAAHVSLSPYHFSRVFKKETGSAPMEYITKLRLNQAMYLLKNTSLSIEDVAAAVGYENYGSFMNRFSKSVGLPPQRFREFPL